MRYVYPFEGKNFFASFEKGGGGGYMPPPTPPPAPVDNTLALEQMKETHDDNVAAQAKQDALDAKNAAIATGNSKLASGYNQALSNAKSQLSVLGLDPTTGYGQQVMQLLTGNLDDDRANADPSTVTDARTVYLPSQYTDAFNQVQGTQKSKLQQQFDNFAGNGFANKMIGDDADNSIIDSIVGNQYNDAESQLQGAFARGLINDGGMSWANRQLDQQKAAATSQARSLGAGVLSTDRQKLSDYVSPYQKQLDNYQLGQNVDLTGAQSGLTSLNNSLGGSMEGDIMNALGGKNFFDPDTLLAQAGTRSGVINAPTATGFGAMSGGSIGGTAGSSLGGNAGGALAGSGGGGTGTASGTNNSTLLATPQGGGALSNTGNTNGNSSTGVKTNSGF